MKVGFWRYKIDEPGEYPWPDPSNDESWVEDKWEFLEKLRYVEAILIRNEYYDAYMGISNCRLCGKHNGCIEFRHSGFVWPGGYMHYIEVHDIKPPNEFIQYVEEYYQTERRRREDISRNRKRAASVFTPTVFIAHSRSEKKFARKLAGELRKYGVTVCAEAARLERNDSIIEKVGERIEENDILIAVLSPKAIKSRWVQQDLLEISKTERINRTNVILLPIQWLIRTCGSRDYPTWALSKYYHVYAGHRAFDELLYHLLETLDICMPQKDVLEADPNERLLRAAKDGNFWLVEALLDEGTDVNSRNGRGETPLHFAIEHRRVHAARILLKRGANVEAKNRLGITPLTEAARWGNPEILFTMLDNSAQDNGARDEYLATALFRAISATDAEAVHQLLDGGAKANVKNGNGSTPLMEAAWWSDIEIVKALLDKGADINVQDHSGKTALMEAARFGRTENVAILLERGADVNAEDGDCQTAFRWAKRAGHVEIAQQLRLAGASERVGKNLLMNHCVKILEEWLAVASTLKLIDNIG